MSIELDPQILDLQNLVLSPLGLLYAIGWKAYEATYTIGLKKPSEPHCPVIVVGNLTVGGMGKTPTTVHVADVLKDLGKKVVISASGYGSPMAAAAQVAPSGELQASKWGDEPALFRWLRPEVPLIVGRRRVLAAELAHQHFPDHVLLLDDGFQHKPLKKHISLLLDPPQPRNPMCLPAGPYREPRSARKKADFVIPGEFQLHSPGILLQTPSCEPVPRQNATVQVLCAIARPWRLTASLEHAGFSIGTSRYLGDHAPMTAGNLLEPFDRNMPLVVTAKDWMKLRERSDIQSWNIWIAHYEVTLQPEAEFVAALKSKLDEIEKTKRA